MGFQETSIDIGGVIMKYNFDTKSDQVLIFADILGFSNLIKTHDVIEINVDGEQNDDITLEFSSFAGYLNEKIKVCFSALKYLWMSDSFAISSDLNNVDNVIECFFNIQHDMFCSGLALRGAICVGDLYHEDNIWGEALVRAVEIEKNKCEYPRVLVHDRDFKKLKISEKYNKYISKTDDNEEYWFIDPFEYEIEKILNGRGPNIEIWPFINLSIEMIENNYYKNKAYKSIVDKWKWLADKMINTLQNYEIDINSMLLKECEKNKTVQLCSECILRLKKIGVESYTK